MGRSMHNVTQLYPTSPTIEEAVLGREHSIFEDWEAETELQPTETGQFLLSPLGTQLFTKLK